VASGTPLAWKKAKAWLALSTGAASARKRLFFDVLLEAGGLTQGKDRHP